MLTLVRLKIAIAVANNIIPNTQSFVFELPVLPPGSNYFIAFVAIDNVNNVYANSSSFPIAANPTSSSVPLSSVKTSAAGTKTSSSHPAYVFSFFFLDPFISGTGLFLCLSLDTSC